MPSGEVPSLRISVFRRRSDHEPPLELDEPLELEEPPELEEPLEPEPPPMPPPELELPPELFSERAKAGSLAVTLLTVGVVFLAGVALLAGSSLANNVLEPGSKMQLCRIAPEPTRNVEHNRTRMMSLLFM